MTINEFLIKKISFSTRDAISIIQQKRVIINKQCAIQKQQVSITDLILLDDKIIQQPHTYFYLVFYKPRGVECTMNKNIEHNLRDALPLLQTAFFPIGRLDKDSEGLLLLTNDGQYYNKIAPDGVFIEKEYIVKVDKLLTDEAIIQLSKGF